MIQYNKQRIDRDDIEAVIGVLESDFLTQGGEVPKFELNLANYCNVEYVSAMSSGTAALHLSMLALGVTNKSIVWTSAISFIATSNAALYCGAEVYFVDIDLFSGCMSSVKLKEKLEATDKSDLPDVIVVVDYAGHCSDLKEIKILSTIYKFKIIEDACHSLGGEYENRKIGCCQYADITVLSFHAIKSITTGEGGAITTNDYNLFECINKLRSHGVIKSESGYPWEYCQILLGYNYRMSDMQAALGSSQLLKLDYFVDRRNDLSYEYSRNITKGVTPVKGDDKNKSSCHLYSVLIDGSKNLDDLNDIFKYFKSRNINLQKHYIPIYKQDYYSKLKDYTKLRCCEEFYIKQVSLPLYVELSKEIVREVCASLNEYVDDNIIGFDK